MPRYIYRCLECMFTEVYVHSMKESADVCNSCGQTGSLVREPAAFTTRSTGLDSKRRPGELVKEFIEDVKKEVSSEKTDLMREYDV
jgi:hypothetical protein